MTGDTIAQVRYQEASSVAEALGGEFRSLGAKDGYSYDTQELRRSLTAVLQEVRADLVFAPPPNDYHFDHITASELAFSAVYYAKNYFVGTAGDKDDDKDDTVEVDRLQRVPALYYYDSVAGMGFEPSFYIDISAHFEKKRDLVALHRSQMANMKSVGGWDLVEYIEIVSRFRGLQAGSQYAEAFQSCVRWPRNPALRAFPF
jgi:LmbE family N-acetylglucosaminyl deacetylase